MTILLRDLLESWGGGEAWHLGPRHNGNDVFPRRDSETAM